MAASRVARWSAPPSSGCLGEVAAGRVDIIVVYKVDRLTRSLLDFSKLVEAFDAAGTSFVSVTQSFNTTTSMGRLTLNMLLSFAQFEREVTTERIRDKIAASKARGMWMGGTPPLGYAPDGRTLIPVEEHAGLVRHLFTRYLALGNVRLVEEELIRAGIRNPVRQRGSGSSFGGSAIYRGQIYAILKNPIYIGRIRHRGTSHVGLHPAIVPIELWDQVQALLAENLKGERSKLRAASPSLLTGRIVDAEGEPLVATHANKGKVRHRYYVSRALQQATSNTGIRLPAREIENLVAERLVQLVADPIELAAVAWLEVPPHQLEELHRRCKELEVQLRQRHSPALVAILHQVQVGTYDIGMTCDMAALATALTVTRSADAPPTITLTVTARLTRSRRALRLVQDNGSIAHATPDRSLVRLLVKARRWWAILRAGEISPTELAARGGVTNSYVTRVVRLAFLAPAVTDAILAGKQRAEVTVASLTVEGGVVPCWKGQVATMLPARVVS